MKTRVLLTIIKYDDNCDMSSCSVDIPNTSLTAKEAMLRAVDAITNDLKGDKCG